LALTCGVPRVRRALFGSHPASKSKAYSKKAIAGASHGLFSRNARLYIFALSDDDCAVSGYCEISVIPTTVAIDQTRRIAGSIMGDASSEHLRQMIGKAKRNQGK
jgi:hypothetical protein